MIDILSILNNTKAKGKDKVKINLLDGYLDHFATDSVNKYDRGFSLSSTEIKSVLEKNNFQTKLRELGYKLSIDGYGYGLVIFRYQKQNIIEFVNIYDYKKKFGKLTQVWFDSGETISIRDAEGNYKEEKVYGHFYYDGNKVMRSEMYLYNGDWSVVEGTTPIVYDVKEIPVVVFTNNSLKTPDIKPVSRNLILQLEKLLNKLPDEFEKGKTIFAFNNLLNSAQTGKEFENAVVENGKSTFDFTDPDGNVANAMAPMTTGMNAVEMIEKLFGFYDQRAREYSFMFRDHGSDTRKSEFDLAMFNQSAFEYMMTKITHRQSQLQEFIDLLARIMKVKTAKITLKISEFEQNRIDNLKAITDLKVAQAKQAVGIASKNTAEAKAITDGSAKPVDPSAVKTNLNIEDTNTKGV